MLNEPKQAVLLGLKGNCQKLEFLQWPGSKTKSKIMLKMAIFTIEINIHPDIHPFLLISYPIHVNWFNFSSTLNDFGL